MTKASGGGFLGVMLANSPNPGIQAASHNMMPLIVSEVFATAAAQSNSQKSVSQATACRKKIQKKSISNTMINSDEHLSQLSRRRGQSLQSKYKATNNILNRTMTKTYGGGCGASTNNRHNLVDEVLS